MGHSVLKIGKLITELGALFIEIFHFEKSMLVNYRKGTWLIFPNLDMEIGPRRAMYSNANEVGDVGGSHGKRSLFFLRSPIPRISLPGDRDKGSVNHSGFCNIQCALFCRLLKTPRNRCEFHSRPYPYTQQVSEVQIF